MLQTGDEILKFREVCLLDKEIRQIWFSTRSRK